MDHLARKENMVKYNTQCMHCGEVKSPTGTKAGCSCNGKHLLSGETSNRFSACPSHDSFLENAESKVWLRASATSEDVYQKVVMNHCFAKASKCDGDQIFSNQHGLQKESERSGDNISCISGSFHRNVVAYNLNGDAETKNESCSLASVNSFPVIIPFNCQTASRYMVNSLSCKLDNNHTRRTDKFTNESSQAVAVCSNKSGLSEISSLRVSSSGTSSLKGGPLEYPEERLKSSLNRVITPRVGGQIKNVHNYAECLNSDNELNDRIPGVEVKCPDNKKCFEKSIAKVEEPNISEPPLHSQLVDNSKESDAAELEVKICDICGDTGREDLLANCSKCSDGAEHIYCMRTKLDKIPERDWMCEECMLIEETRNHVQDKLEDVVTRVSSESSLHRTKGNLGRSSVYKNSLKLCVKGSLSKNIRSKVKSVPYFSSKRSAGCLEAVPVIKQRAFNSIKQSGFPKPLDKMCVNSSFENTSKGKIKQTLYLNISGDHLSDHTLGVSHKSHNLQGENLISQGYLSKSKSFMIADAKGEVLRMDGGVLKQNYARQNAFVKNNVARGASRMMKSMSFSNAILDSKNASDSKVVNCYSNFSQVKDLKRLRHAKEQSSTDSEFTSQFHNPLVSSLVGDTGVNSLMTDKKNAYGKIISPLSSGITAGPAKTEQARDVLRKDSCEREERDSKRVRMLHHSVKVDSECNMDIARVAQERENKRPKSCFYRMDELHNFPDIKCLGATFSIGMNGLGSTSTSNNRIRSRAYDVPISSTKFASIDGRMGTNSVQQQVILNDGSDHFNSTLPDLELSLGFRKKSARQRAMPLFGTEYSEDLLNKHSKTSTSEKRDGIESSVVPLSLSLALPFSDNEQVSNPSLKTHFQLPEWCGVNTSLSL